MPAPSSISTSSAADSRLGRAARYAGHVARYRLAALAGSLNPGGRDYVRFVIVGQGRSGTNLVRGLLNSHPAVIAHGELFRDYEHPAPGMPRLLQSGRSWRMKHADPGAFIDDVVFRRFPPSIRAVGFKLFANQAREGSWSSVWDRLAADTGLRVVHTVRRDRLAVLASLRLAEESDQWVNSTSTGTVTLSPSEVSEFVAAADAADDALRERFLRHERLEVVYEDLLSRVDETLVDLQRFIGVPPTALQASTTRQSGRPVAETIVNYDALERHFADTPLAYLFRRQPI